MGVMTFLVSDSTKEHCALGKVFLDEDILVSLKAHSSALLMSDWLRRTNGEFNRLSPSDIRGAADVASAWMRAHPDWRFVTDADETYDDAYLAVDDEDAREYEAEFGSGLPIYRQTGTV